MKNIEVFQLSKHENSDQYKLTGDGIFEDLSDESQFRDNFKIGISFELENDEDSQYPLESILDKYGVHVSEFIEMSNTQFKIEIGGQYENVKNILEIIGKRVYERPIGQTKRLELVIEEIEVESTNRNR